MNVSVSIKKYFEFLFPFHVSSTGERCSPLQIFCLFVNIIRISIYKMTTNNFYSFRILFMYIVCKSNYKINSKNFWYIVGYEMVKSKI